MYIASAVLILILIAGIIIKFSPYLKKVIVFFTGGLDQRFILSELFMLWKVARICELEEPAAIYWSVPVLLKCISTIKSKSDSSACPDPEEYRRLLTALYTFRTKLEKLKDDKKGLDSTRALSEKQSLRVILPGIGVFFSEIVNNARELIIKMPMQKNCITVEGKHWVGKNISVFLWRQHDAMYSFDTVVQKSGMFLGKPVLFIEHSSNLIRSQKRNAIRAQCKIYGDLYILKDKVIDYNAVESVPGYRCLIEDISENGALIKIGGKGMPNVRIRLQFKLDDKLIDMFGIVHNVEFDEESNQSKLHFECIHTEPEMRNIILAYVYNILTESEKEIFDALSLTESDGEVYDEVEAESEKLPVHEFNSFDESEEPEVHEL
ncbi:MAG: PilZ domain-containing protein [Treponema sp.]